MTLFTHIARLTARLSAQWERFGDQAFQPDIPERGREDMARGEFISALIIEKGSGLPWAEGRARPVVRR